MVFPWQAKTRIVLQQLLAVYRQAPLIIMLSARQIAVPARALRQAVKPVLPGAVYRSLGDTLSYFGPLRDA